MCPVSNPVSNLIDPSVSTLGCTESELFNDVLTISLEPLLALLFQAYGNNNINSKLNKNIKSRKRGYRVQSFGTGSCVKLPGATLDKPNIYSFDTPYQDQFVDLKVRFN